MRATRHAGGSRTAERTGTTSPLSIVALLAATALLGVRSDAAAAEPEPPSRGAVDVYERGRESIRDILALVVGDLRGRAQRWGRPFAANAPQGVLVLVVDPTTSMKPDVMRLREALPEVVAAGPAGLRVGVLGAACEGAPPGTVKDASDALTLLHTVPLDGRKNLFDAVREAAGWCSTTVTEPRALVLVTRDGGDGEDDVEATRGALSARGIAFYSIAPEAAFERPWDYDHVQTTVDDLGLTQRLHPCPRQKRKGELFFGGDVAFGLVPYRWELERFPFAHTEFAWPGSNGRFPAPSGFGYWCLATLSYTTQGRCFVHNFRAPGARTTKGNATQTLYDMGFLNLFAPDLRPRDEVRQALDGMKRAHAIVRIWEHLADATAPVVLDHGTLERPGGGALAPRPMLPVRSTTPFPQLFRSKKDVQEARATALERKKRVEQALEWWTDEGKREVTTAESARSDPLRRRVEADFDLLGCQLAKVAFHWGEVLAALDGIERHALDESNAAYLRPEVIAVGVNVTRPRLTLPDPNRSEAFLASMASVRKVAAKYKATPWAAIIERGVHATFEVESVDLRPPKVDPARPTSGKPPPPAPPRPPPAPPPEPVRPGSGSGSETTPAK
jgi:hypothetical protein